MKICVYGAASNSINPEYIEMTEELGRQIAERGHSLVFGGGANGLMGAAARGAHEKGGEIIGVTPSFFPVDGVIYPDCTELIRTETMRERKKILEDRSDAFIVTPGGIGTYDEFFEILTLKQLAQHTKPIAILNINNYYVHMEAFMQNAVDQGFLKEASKKLYKFCDTVDEVFEYLDNYVPETYEVYDMKEIERN